MKRLHLIRHAKSSWNDAQLSDHDRPLKPRGRKDAALMAPAIAQLGWRESTLHCSSAQRAVETLQRIQAAAEQPARPAHYHHALYTFSCRDLVDWLRNQSEGDITLVGHNPALHELHEWLSGENLVNFPTCAYSQLTLDIDQWAYLVAGCAQVHSYITPRMLKSQASS